MRIHIDHPKLGYIGLIEHICSRDDFSVFAMPGGGTKTLQQVKNWCWAIRAEYKVDEGKTLSSQKVEGEK